MSEYQFIHFRALDGPLSEEQLALMDRQSTRAHVTRWEFTNEYHFGDFRGDVKGMLRNGYDVHLHFANFGIRRLMFRLPAGRPCNRKTFEKFVAEDGMAWHADKQGEGGILEIYPEADAGTYDFLEDPHSMLDRIAPLRDALMAGDLRPLYLAWLADVAKNPAKVLAEVDRLVAGRSGNSYQQAARKLAELREALGPEKGPGYVQAVARKLHNDNPRRHSLTAALRGEGLLE